MNLEATIEPFENLNQLEEGLDEAKDILKSERYRELDKEFRGKWMYRNPSMMDDPRLIAGGYPVMMRELFLGHQRILEQLSLEGQDVNDDKKEFVYTMYKRLEGQISRIETYSLPMYKEKELDEEGEYSWSKLSDKRKLCYGLFFRENLLADFEMLGYLTRVLK